MTRILVVDDDPHLREVVRYALSRQGFTVVEATNGAEALRLLPRRRDRRRLCRWHVGVTVWVGVRCTLVPAVGGAS